MEIYGNETNEKEGVNKEISVQRDFCPREGERGGVKILFRYEKYTVIGESFLAKS